MILDYLDEELIPIRGNSIAEYTDKYSHLPILDNDEKLVGILLEEDVFSYPNISMEIDPNLIISQNSHPLDGIRKMKESESTVLFLVDENACYLGAISIHSLFRYFENQIDIEENHAIIILKSKVQNFALSDLARIFESEGLKISQFYSKLTSNLNEIEITLSILDRNLNSVLGVLENRGYEVVNLYHESSATSHYRERLDHLMMYLNV